jgi:hypothetical protein
MTSEYRSGFSQPVSKTTEAPSQGGALNNVVLDRTQIIQKWLPIEARALTSLEKPHRPIKAFLPFQLQQVYHQTGRFVDGGQMILHVMAKLDEATAQDLQLGNPHTKAVFPQVLSQYITSHDAPSTGLNNLPVLYSSP